MNPLTLCVMDDIQTVVKGIASTIPWADHGMEVAGTAGNGEQGWELLLEKDPDIVISDIRMPKLSGLENHETGCRSEAAGQIHIHQRVFGFQLCAGGDQAGRLQLFAEAVHPAGDCGRCAEGEADY